MLDIKVDKQMIITLFAIFILQSIILGSIAHINNERYKQAITSHAELEATYEELLLEYEAQLKHDRKLSTELEEVYSDLETKANRVDELKQEIEMLRQKIKKKERKIREQQANAGRIMPASPGTVLTMEATSYTAYCTGCSGITRTGQNLRKNPDLKVIAVDPNVIPLGSKVWVEGYGYAVAGDTGGDIKGNRIDIFKPKRKDALAFGRRSVAVKILD